MLTVLVDKKLNKNDILRQNPKFICPDAILEQITIIDVDYFSFDEVVRRGQIAIHSDLASDIIGAFELLLREKFPIESVIPIADARFKWDDTASTSANNTSAFNYRFVRDTNELSNHATGRAIDINPRLNPYFLGDRVLPANATYNPTVKGTIHTGSNLVAYLENLGWQWGGNWDEDLDFQHFEKV